jgi:hypothetical protein
MTDQKPRPQTLDEAIAAIDANTAAMEDLGTKVDELSASNHVQKWVIGMLVGVVVVLAVVVIVLVPTALNSRHAAAQAKQAVAAVPAATCQSRNQLRATDLHFFQKLASELETVPPTPTDTLINGFIAKAYEQTPCPKAK